MSIINSQPLIGASGNQETGYNLTRSLRFRSSASAYLSRSQVAGNSQKWTWSGWVKRGKLGTGGLALFGTIQYPTPSNYQSYFYFNSDDTFEVFFYTGSTVDGKLTTSQVFRDPSAWYHIIVAVDTTQATANNRMRVYVNGSEVTSFSNRTNPTQNYNTWINNSAVSGVGMGGTYPYVSGYYDGYMAEVNFVDGQQLDASSFGETDTATGVWKPKRYSGSYGTNGFYLNFNDNSAATAAAIGKDSSGNGNNWTPNNISLTSGATYDSMTDVPTLTSATAANYCVINPLSFPGNWTGSNGNLTVSTSQVTNQFGTLGSISGKFYYEFSPTTSADSWIGVANLATNSGIDLYRSDGTRFTGGSYVSYGATYTSGDIIGCAFDIGGGTIQYFKNGVSQGVVSSIAYNGGVIGPILLSGVSGGYNANFGQRPFAYTPPSGFLALNTFNLPTPTIGATESTQANKYMDATLFSSSGGSQNIINAGGFRPDLIWQKSRGGPFGTTGHILNDTVRGLNFTLSTNGTGAEGNNPGLVTAVNADGWTQNGSGIYFSGDPIVGWQWRANGAGASNTAGSITSTVSANTTAGFSIVTFTCTGVNVNGTVGHGLGVAPNMIITKSRGSGSNWVVYHSSVSTDVNKFLRLNDTSATVTLSNVWGDALPTSTVFGVRGDVTLAASATAVAYCFAEVAGYSKFGSYTGNGSSDGPFVFCGFRPRFLLLKRTDTGSSWSILDTARNTTNVVNRYLYPNLADAEYDGGSTYPFDYLSNGFKIRGSGASENANGGTFIYAAFAENPFKYSLAR